MNEFANAIEYGMIAATAVIAILAAFCLWGAWVAARKLLSKGERNAN